MLININLENGLFDKKVKAFEKMMHMLKNMREESENVVCMRGLCPDNKVPKDLVNEGKKVLERNGGASDRSGLF
jgi:hypothetical protein